MDYRRYRSDTVAAAVSTPDRINGAKVPTGFILQVTYFAGGVAVEEARVIELGYVDTIGIDRILRVKKPEIMTSIEITGTIWLEEGEYPYCNVINLNTGSEYFLSIHGKLWPKEVWSRNYAKVQPKD